MTLSWIFFVLLMVFPKMCPADLRDTRDDIASLASLVQQLVNSNQGCAQQNALQERVTKIEVSLSSIESTVNRLVSENAQLKEAVSQEAKLEDMRRRLTALEDSDHEQNATVSAYDKDGKWTVTKCSSPFTEVMGRCVRADPAVSGKWEDMRQHCRTLGADLVIVDSADFLWALIRYLEQMGLNTTDYWLGGVRETGTGVFHWVDGSPIKLGTPFWGYHNGYSAQQPYDNNVELHICIWRKGLYFMHSCSVGHIQSPICQKK